MGEHVDDMRIGAKGCEDPARKLGRFGKLRVPEGSGLEQAAPLLGLLAEAKWSWIDLLLKRYIINASF
jgi:hypothetical protein